MDFGTVTTKLQNGNYKEIREFLKDMRLVFSNCWLFNKKGTLPHKAATAMSNQFENEAEAVCKRLGYCCGLNDKKLNPTALWCSMGGANNPHAIPQNAEYYK